SLTRSPDIVGAFVQHPFAAGANGRLFSAGLKTNGTPFSNCPSHLITLSISPLAATVNVGETDQLTAQAFDDYGRAMKGVPITFTSDNITAATIDSVSTNPITVITSASAGGHNPGTAHIRASATDGITT